jgi:hypothetical protein
LEAGRAGRADEGTGTVGEARLAGTPVVAGLVADPGNLGFLDLGGAAGGRVGIRAFADPTWSIAPVLLGSRLLGTGEAEHGEEGQRGTPGPACGEEFDDGIEALGVHRAISTR